MPRERPGDKFGTSQGHPGRLGRFMWKFTFKGQNVRGTDGTDDGTDGTCPRDRRDTNQGGVPPKFFMFVGFFFPQFRPWMSARMTPKNPQEYRTSCLFGLFSSLILCVFLPRQTWGKDPNDLGANKTQTKKKNTETTISRESSGESKWQPLDGSRRTVRKSAQKKGQKRTAQKVRKRAKKCENGPKRAKTGEKV